MNEFYIYAKPKLNKLEFDILQFHTQPNPKADSAYMLKNTETAMKKYNLTYRELRIIVEKLEDLAVTFERQEFLYG